MGTGLVPLPTSASTLRSDVLGLLPPEAGEIAFIDLQTLRASPHYFSLKQRLAPSQLADFERSLRPLGIDVDKDLDWLAWVLVAPGPERSQEGFLGIVQGQFVPERVAQFFQQQESVPPVHRGQILFPLGESESSTLYFFFLDSSTIAFGPRATLERLIERRMGGQARERRNQTLLERVRQVNGRVPVWVVFDDYYTQLALRQLIPEVAKLEEFPRLVKRIRSSLMGLSLGREADLRFQLWCVEALDAQAFSPVLQVALLAQSWNLRKSDPALSAVLGKAEVHAVGERLEAHLVIEEENLRALLERPQP